MSFEESQKEEIFMFVCFVWVCHKILENRLSLSLSLKRRRAPYQKQKHEKTIMNDKKEEEERERFFRATTTSSTTLKKEEEEKKYATRVFLLLLALLFALLFFFSRISRSTTSSDAAAAGRPVAVTMQEKVEEIHAHAIPGLDDGEEEKISQLSIWETLVGEPSREHELFFRTKHTKRKRRSEKRGTKASSISSAGAI